MNILWEVSSLYLEQCQQFIIWAYIISHMLDNTALSLQRDFQIIVNILQILYSEGYCYYIDFILIVYYPITNCQYIFLLIIQKSIVELTDQDVRDMAGLSVSQLQRLHGNLRIPNEFIHRLRYTFIGEESLLHYLVFNRNWETKFRLSWNYFDRHPRRFAYSIRIMIEHLYNFLLYLYRVDQKLSVK